jgi:hypothetical protein
MLTFSIDQNKKQTLFVHPPFFVQKKKKEKISKAFQSHKWVEKAEGIEKVSLTQAKKKKNKKKNERKNKL